MAESAGLRPLPVLLGMWIAAAASIAGQAGAPVAPPAAAPPLDLAARVRAALADYGERYTATVATERYVQRANGDHVSLESDFGITRMNGSWLGIRDVLRVDGHPVTTHRDRVAQLLEHPGASMRAVADAIAADSARYNLGVISRTINSPAVVFAVLNVGGPPNVAFEPVKPDAGTTAKPVRIDFKESGRPTVFRTSRGIDEPAEGSVWVQPASGRLVRADVRIGIVGRNDAIAARGTISVEFGEDPGIGLWVPTRMTETYSDLSGHPLANGEATYTNYRKFDVVTSERPQGPVGSAH